MYRFMLRGIWRTPAGPKPWTSASPKPNGHVHLPELKNFLSKAAQQPPNPSHPQSLFKDGYAMGEFDNIEWQANEHLEESFRNEGCEK